MAGRAALRDAGAAGRSDGLVPGGDEVPREVLVPALPPDADAVPSCSARPAVAGRLRVPAGDKRALLETVTRNASQSLASTHKLRRSGTSPPAARRSPSCRGAGPAHAPLRIECFDVSNLGADVVASMVVFEDGLPRPSEYRKFAIRGFAGQNDVAAIGEVGHAAGSSA